MPTWLLEMLRERGLIEEDASDDEIRSAVEKYLGDNDDKGGDPATPPAAPPAAPGDGDEDPEAARAESDRVRQLAFVAQLAGMEADLPRWLSDGTTVEAARAAALKKRAAGNPKTPLVSFEVDERDKTVEAVRGILVQRAMADSPTPLDTRERHFGKIPAAAKDLPLDMKILDLARFHAIRGGHPDAWRWDQEQLVRYACGKRAGPVGTSSDFPYLLADVATKSLNAAFSEYPATYPGWTQALEVPDFKTAKRVKVSGSGDFKLNPEGMPIEEASFADISEGYNVATYGRIFSVTRRALIDDDLDAISQTPAKFGIAAQRTINKLVYSTFLANPTMAEDSKALFATDHPSGGNLAASGAAFSLDALAAGMVAMGLQKGFGEDTEALNIAPSFVMIPLTKSTVARQIIEGQVNATTAATAILPWMRNLRVISDPLLDANSTTAWYLGASPGMSGVDGMAVVFLRGRKLPTTEREDTGDILGVRWRSYIDFGAKVLEHRSFYKNPGA